MDHFETATTTLQGEPLRVDLLSARERDVVERAVSGADNKVIAYDLGLCHSTVRVFMMRAASKLGVRTRHEVVRLVAAAKARAPARAA